MRKTISTASSGDETLAARGGRRQPFRSLNVNKFISSSEGKTRDQACSGLRRRRTRECVRDQPFRSLDVNKFISSSEEKAREWARATQRFINKSKQV